MKNPLRLLILGLFTLAGPAGAEEGVSQSRPKNALTFSKDIAPLIFRNCTVCHRSGEVAPFTLMTYRDVQKRAKQIAQVTSERIMPPWKAIEGHGKFVGERRLTNAEIGLFRQWAEEGAREGDSKDLPPAPKFADGWRLGEPDQIVTMPAGYQVPAEGRDIYRNFVIPMEIPAGKYIRAVEYRPSNPRVVHHAALSSDRSGKYQARDGKDGAPGFTQVAFAGQLLPGTLGFWVPGKEPRPVPEGVAVRWEKGTDLLLQLHLHPSGKPEVEQSKIALYFTEQSPRRQLGGMVINHTKIDIPAGEKNYRTKDAKTLPADILISGIFPHMHMIGKEVKVTAIRPDGKRESLLWIAQWDFNWQNYYEYASPVPLPKGTEIVMECIHDNSADNPSNPSQPPKRVTFGEQTTNEMAAILINTISPPAGAVSQEKPAPTIEDPATQAKEAIRRFDLDKDGKLSEAEIKQIPAAAGQDIRALFARFDKDGDGKLDAIELAEAVRVLRK